MSTYFRSTESQTNAHKIGIRNGVFARKYIFTHFRLTKIMIQRGLFIFHRMCGSPLWIRFSVFGLCLHSPSVHRQFTEEKILQNLWLDDDWQQIFHFVRRIDGVDSRRAGCREQNAYRMFPSHQFCLTSSIRETFHIYGWTMAVAPPFQIFIDSRGCGAHLPLVHCPIMSLRIGGIRFQDIGIIFLCLKMEWSDIASEFS